MTAPAQSALRHFEDLVVGETVALGRVTVSRDMIVTYARQFDPLPFHLDEAAAKASLLGGLAASGWQTAALTLRLLDDAWQSHVASLGSSAVANLKWKKPVLVGDTITGTATISRLAPEGEAGLATLTLAVVNQRGADIMSLDLDIRVARRDRAAA